uniref:SMAX1-like nucleotide binding domain-containing protein n=1 Tax=Arundo donax TaxID=35708 RepID=A0A0A8ZG45_ARUDO
MLVVVEIEQLLRQFGSGKVWAVNTTACTTYLQYMVNNPTMEAKWDL